GFQGASGRPLAVSGRLSFQAFDYVTASAHFSLTRQSVNVDLDGNGTLDPTDLHAASLLQFELHDVNLFAGIGNPDTNGDGVFDQKDMQAITSNPAAIKATGFAATGGGLGPAIITAHSDPVPRATPAPPARPPP